MKAVRPLGHKDTVTTATARIETCAKVFILAARCLLCAQFTGSVPLQLAWQDQTHVDGCTNYGVGTAAVGKAHYITG